MSMQHEYSANYFADRDRSPTFHLEHAAFRRVLRDNGALDGRILEVGAGAGTLGRTLSNEASIWIASDVNPAPLAGASHERLRSLACDALHLPFRPATFHAVVAQHVVEHFPDPVAALRSWVGVVRPGGTCVVTTPNRLFPHQDWFEDPTHFELFDASRLAQTLRDAGLESVSVVPLIPWLGSTRTVFLSARVHRYLLGVPLPIRRSLNLMASGRVPR